MEGNPLTPLFIPCSLSRKLSGAVARNKNNSVNAEFLSIPNFTTLYILYFLFGTVCRKWNWMVRCQCDAWWDHNLYQLYKCNQINGDTFFWSTFLYTNTNTQTQTNTHTHNHKNKNEHTQMHTYTNIPSHTHTHTHTYIHTNTYSHTQYPKLTFTDIR